MGFVPLRLVFCGTPAYAVPTLRALVGAGHEVVLAVSQPDKPIGREGVVAATPVKAAAIELGIPVVQPVTLKRNEELRAELTALAPDCIVVVAYGRILPQWILDLPRLGCVNAHGSLLPRWRGAAPIQWAIASGDAETGVTTMQMDAGLDTGAMLLKRVVPVEPETTAVGLFGQLAEVSAELVVETLERMQSGGISAVPQENDAATLAPLLTREDGRIDWSRTATEIDRRFRGFQPWPGAWTTLRGKKLIVHGMIPATPADLIDVDLPTPGFIRAPKGSLLVQGTGATLLAICGDGRAMKLLELQLEGKKRMSATDFMRGLQVQACEVLG